jgi:SPP1 family phage portal protein
MRTSRLRTENELYPDYSDAIDIIDERGINNELLHKIIKRHKPNALYNRSLFKRYEMLEFEVPILNRTPRFKTGKGKPINNKLANDFFGEIVDFATGYFAGKPIAYSYSDTEESIEDTGNDEAVRKATKALTDFVTRNNMFDRDMEATRFASICGYAGRLFYRDPDGCERVMILPAYETIILTKTDITEPEYAVRYFYNQDLNGNVIWNAEFYDNEEVVYYKGSSVSSLAEVKREPHYYGSCPLQGIPRNSEMMGDPEKVMTLIDAYDRCTSDCSNQIEGEVNSKTVYKNVKTDEEEIQKSNITGAIQFMDVTGNGDIYKLQNNVNDNFTEHHLERLKNNIYRFSKTPNLSDETFGTASGESLKFKLTGHEAKCGMFQAKMMSAGVYMFKLLAYCFNARKIAFAPLQCVMSFSRNFPIAMLTEAQTAQALISAGVPEKIAYSEALSFVDDINYLMQLKDEEKGNIPSLEDTIKEDFEEAEDEPEEEIEE